MKKFEEMEYHQESEDLVKILCEKTQNDNPLFFRVLVAYYWAMAASMMRVSIDTPDRGNIPVNLYALNLSTSGSGKGFSMNILEKEVMAGFRRRYLEDGFPAQAELAINRLAVARAGRKGTDLDEELKKVTQEFVNSGELLFSFDSGTTAAIKQQRHKMLMADAGSLNLQVDEIGSNLEKNEEILTLFLELFDVGAVKQKLVKNTAENTRSEEIVGATPSNMLMFGTPSKLLNGGKVEDMFYSLLETGYARRCFFGYSRQTSRSLDYTPEQIYDMLTNKASSQFIDDMSDKLEILADASNMNKKLLIQKPVSLLLIEYKTACERIAYELPEHEDIKKAEISHRYFKALKLAGAYAFIDDSPEVLESHVYSAIKLAEESGEAFHALLTRDRAYVKLAKYICTCRRSVTQADLVEDLPFYKGSMAQKSEMLQLAIAYGHTNNMVIKKIFSDGVEFLRGETLEETNTAEMIVAYSEDIAKGYDAEAVPFDELHNLTQTAGYHWTNHGFAGGHRSEDNAIPGFNMVVIDVDEGTTLETVRATMQGFKYMIYTTKRHTPEVHRFRLIIPMNFKLKLDAKEYKEFMNNIFEWLPFDVDTATNQRARKWLSHDGDYEYGDGELLDILPFIPKTTKNEERKQLLNSQAAMNALERWMINNTGDGNRNNMLHRYGKILVDAGASLEETQQQVIALNSKLPDKLDDAELYTTILASVAKAIAKRGDE